MATDEITLQEENWPAYFNLEKRDNTIHESQKHPVTILFSMRFWGQISTQSLNFSLAYVPMTHFSKYPENEFFSRAQNKLELRSFCTKTIRLMPDRSDCKLVRLDC